MSSGSEYSQGARLIGLTTPLGEDVLLLRSMRARERLSTLFEFELDLLSEDGEIAAADLLGQTASVRLETRDRRPRFFHGYVSRFAHLGFEGRLACYRATLVPWLWLLTRTSDCRIFQSMTVPDIIQQVFQDIGFTDVEDRLSADYRQWEYCVQYRETHFNFVSRLMEHEGIYWFFTHQEDKHTLVLADDYGSLQSAPGYERIRYHAADLAGERDQDFIFAWTSDAAIRPGAFAHDDFDFKKPSVEMRASAALARSHAKADFEIYDYPGDYVELGEGDRYARVRMQELQSDHETVRGESYARGLTLGHLFSLTDYPRQDRNREYLVTSALTELRTDAYQTSEAGAEGPAFRTHFTAIDAHEPYRAPRVTPKPMVKGPQTAIVVGPAGEEIWTDEYGRVKVQFHWDRYGGMDENSSCWIRVSHPWAGQNWGAISIPRIGQEVIVSFLEGDPDRPIITGRVYNAEQMPPFPLPSGKVVSGIKSDTHKGQGYNELSMDDTAGQERVTIHAQYDMNTTVEHDQTSTIHNNRTDTIGVDDSETVGSNQSVTIGANQTIDVGGNRTETVGGSESITIGASRAESVGGAETVSIGGGRTHSVGGIQSTTIAVAETHSVGAGRMHSVGAAEAINVGGVQTVTIGGAQVVSVGAVQSVSVGGAHKLSSAAISQSASGPVKITAGGVCMVEAPTIVLKAGGSQVILNAGGVTIKGAKVSIKANGSVSINGPGGIKLKGATIGEN